MKKKTQKLPDFRHAKTFLWIASDSNNREFLRLRNKRNVRRINLFSKIFRVRDDAKIYAERCADDKQFKRAFFGPFYHKRFLQNLSDARLSETPIILIICGELPGGAKSFSGIKLALYLDTSFNVHEQLFMNETDFTRAANAGLLQSNKVYIFDDPDNARTGAGVVARKERLEKLLRQAARHEQADFIFCSAVKLESNILDFQNTLFFLESIGKDKENNKAYFMLYDRNKRALGLIPFLNPQIDTPDIISQYLEIKSAFTSKILVSGGRQATTEIEAAAMQIIEHPEFFTCINARSEKIVISKLAPLVYDIFPDSKEMVTLITRKIERMSQTGQININDYLYKILGNDEPEEIIEKGTAFIFEEKRILEQLAKKKTWTDNIDIYQLAQDGLTQDDIALKFALSQVRISQRIKKVKGELARQLGAARELFLVQQLKQDQDVKQVIHSGGVGEPDIIVKYKSGRIEVISVKCYTTSKARASTSIIIDELLPEIITCRNFAKKLIDIHLILDFYNYNTRQHVRKEIDFNAPPERINIQTKK